MQTTPKITRARRGLLATMVRFLRGRRGAVAPIMALALIPIVGAMGMGAEASSWWLTQRSAQNAADAAAMAAAVDGGNNYVSGVPAGTVPTNCTSASDTTTSWYCQAKAAAAKYGFDETVTANHVTVTPLKGACPGTVTTYSVCYKVTVQKAVPLYLLSVVGFNGNTTIGTAKAQFVSATAYAGAPGPPIDFCMLTTNGDFQTNGSKSADLLGCSTFANGNSNCNGHGDGIGSDYASGTASCPLPDVNVPSQAAQCDPYGANPQTIQGVSVTCSSATNVSGSVPNSTCGSYNSLDNGGANFPTANILTTAKLAAAAGGTIQLCGNSALGAGTVTNTMKNGKVNGTTVDGCTSTVNYTAAQNVTIVVYNGYLNLNGCTLETSGVGGMTVVFAPPTATAGSTCPTSCVPLDPTNSGVIDIAAPETGTFKGIAIMQSANYTESGGTKCNGSGGGPIDWCAAGNSPTLKIQGGLYMPQAELGFSGAISKFDGVAGALNCIGLISKSIYVNGTGSLFNNFTGGLTSGCNTAGWTIPTVPGSHTFFQKLVA